MLQQKHFDNLVIFNAIIYWYGKVNYSHLTKELLIRDVTKNIFRANF